MQFEMPQAVEVLERTARGKARGTPEMKGVRYLVDEDGDRTAVVIDLRLHGEVWEDLYDAVTARKRRREPRETLAQVKRRLRRTGKLRRNG